MPKNKPGKSANGNCAKRRKPTVVGVKRKSADGGNNGYSTNELAGSVGTRVRVQTETTGPVGASLPTFIYPDAASPRRHPWLANHVRPARRTMLSGVSVMARPLMINISVAKSEP